MKRWFAVLALVALILTVSDRSANAGTRNFFKPTVGGDRLSFCVGSGNTCGKPIADAWCRAIGFEEALNYQRERGGGGQTIVARYADTGGVCRGKDCQVFRQIKCWNSAS